MKKAISCILMIVVVLMMGFGNYKKMYAAEVSESDKYYEQVLSFLEEQKQNLSEEMFFAEEIELAQYVYNPYIMYRVGEYQQDKVYYYPISDEQGAFLKLLEIREMCVVIRD